MPTRALLLSAYIKFINLFPETKATIQEVLRSDSQIRNSDVELQQRAVEYLKLSSIASTDVLVRTGDFETGLLRQFGRVGTGIEPWSPVERCICDCARECYHCTHSSCLATHPYRADQLTFIFHKESGFATLPDDF